MDVDKLCDLFVLKGSMYGVYHSEKPLSILLNEKPEAMT